ncbi:MAG TPA: hypothetical protein VMT32_07470 [Bryobacteraceae bacterium]|nr:hypothetical protein [Bryobacteraceae bacterium]
MAGKAAGVPRIVSGAVRSGQVREANRIQDDHPKQENAERRPPVSDSPYTNARRIEDG